MRRRIRQGYPGSSRPAVRTRRTAAGGAQRAGRGEGAMASGKAYLDFMTDQLSELEDISFVPMMGEYILRYRGKVVGGIYDDRFLVKVQTSSTFLHR